MWLLKNRLLGETPKQTHPELDVQTSRLPFHSCKRLDEEHQYLADPLGALADFKIILEKARWQIVRELSRKKLDSMGAKLSTASSPLRAYGNRHLGTLMRCRQAWGFVGKCFDPISFECTDFRGLSQIIASLTRENFAEREAETGNHPLDTYRERQCYGKMQAWASTMARQEAHALPFALLLMKTAIFWKTKMNRVEGYVIFSVRLFKHAPKVQGITTTKILLRYVQKVPDDIRWIIDQDEFDELMTCKKEPALVADGIPYSFLADVREGWVRGFCLVHANMCWKVVLFLSFLPKVALSLFPNPPTLTTEGLLDHRRLYAR